MVAPIANATHTLKPVEVFPAVGLTIVGHGPTTGKATPRMPWAMETFDRSDVAACCRANGLHSPSRVHESWVLDDGCNRTRIGSPEK